MYVQAKRMTDGLPASRRTLSRGNPKKKPPAICGVQEKNSNIPTSAVCSAPKRRCEDSLVEPAASRRGEYSNGS